jgi:hypothetical protein
VQFRQAGSDATRVSSYNPWVSLYWLVTGRTVGGHELWSESARLDRMKALRRRRRLGWQRRAPERRGLSRDLEPSLGRRLPLLTG